MSTNQSRRKRQEVPFRIGRFQDVIRRNFKLLKNPRYFVYEGDIYVALRVLDDLGGLRRLNVLGEENISAIHTSIYFGQLFRYRRCLTRNDFDDLIDGMNGVPGIDSLRRIPEKKVLAAPKAGNLLDRCPANVFRDARIDRTLNDYD